MPIKKFVLLLEAWCRERGYRPSSVYVRSLTTTWRGGQLVHDVLLSVGGKEQLVSFADENTGE